MENTTKMTLDPETGYYLYPERPPGIPECESEYPKEYTLKEYTQEEIREFEYYRSIRGYNITRMSKGDVNVLINNETIQTMQGWIPGESGLIFRSLAIGLINIDGWSVVERNTGISLMPDIQVEDENANNDLQLSFDFIINPPKTEKATGSTREKAIELATANVKYFKKEQWIEIQEKVDYDLAGVEIKHILTPEQEKLEAEHGERISEVNRANTLIRETDNFYNRYKPLEAYEHSTDRPKMTRWKKVNDIRVKLPEKLNTRKKVEFYYEQEEFSHCLKVQGILVPIEIEGCDEIKDLVIVKGDQFKGTLKEESFVKSNYYIFEPYLGIGMCHRIKNTATSIKTTYEKITKDSVLLRATPDGLKILDQRIRDHHEKIRVAKSDEDITRFLNLN